MTARRPASLTFSIYGPIARADLTGLADRVRALLTGAGAQIACCDVRGIPADAVAVDALARVQLVARRQGCALRLRGASQELLELIAFVGLADVLAAQPWETE